MVVESKVALELAQKLPAPGIIPDGDVFVFHTPPEPFNSDAGHVSTSAVLRRLPVGRDRFERVRDMPPVLCLKDRRSCSQPEEKGP
jgi:hypothetical protein